MSLGPISYALYSVSQKNITSLILNNFNKLEPISKIFACSISSVSLQISYILLTNLLWTYFTLQYVTVA